MIVSCVNCIKSINQNKRTNKPLNQNFKAKGVYAGSFDPITNGHMNIIERASKFLDSLIVVVGINPEKIPFLTVEQRANLIKKSVKPFKNVTVASNEGFTVDFAKNNNADVLIRGIRNENDLIFEKKVSDFNRNLAPSIDTILLQTVPEFESVSSSLVRKTYSDGGDISKLVPECVRQTLNLKKTFDSTTKNMGLSKDNSIILFDDFIRAYDNPSRGYHDLSHVENMITEFDIFEKNNILKVKNKDEFIYSIFMHDYVNGVENDVEKSAQYALQNLKGLESDSAYVNKLIRATDYSKNPKISSFDEGLMQDLDLSVLGKNPNEYQKYSKQIRNQYLDYSDEIYNPSRIIILQSFLNKESIYNTQYFKQKFESQARQNISNEISMLKSSK